MTLEEFLYRKTDPNEKRLMTRREHTPENLETIRKLDAAAEAETDPEKQKLILKELSDFTRFGFPHEWVYREKDKKKND